MEPTPGEVELTLTDVHRFIEALAIDARRYRQLRRRFSESPLVVGPRGEQGQDVRRQVPTQLGRLDSLSDDEEIGFITSDNKVYC